MKLKTKIRLALLVVFAAVTLFGVIGVHFLNKTTAESMEMLQDNYRTMKYTREMSLALNDMLVALALDSTAASFRWRELRKAFDRFELYLNLQLRNVTETREINLTRSLQENYQQFKANVERMEGSKEVSTELYMQSLHIQELLQSVYGMNEKAILEKTDQANRTADRITLILIILGIFFFTFAVFSFIYFPHYLADPILALTESIRQIAQKNYSQRLAVKTDDEFGEMARSFNLMAQKLEEYESINLHQLLSEKRRIETIIERINEPIIGLDRELTVLFANQPTLQLLGMRADEVIGRDAYELSLLSSFARKLFGDLLRRPAGDNKPFPSSILTLPRQDSRLYFSRDILSVDNQDDGPEAFAGYVILLKNVTELKEQDLAKTNFMATLSHELKTPISAIDMSLNLLEDERIGALNAEQRELADTIRQNAARLLKMVNEILDMSKIEAGHVDIRLSSGHPREVVDKALQHVKTFLDEKRLRVDTHLEDKLPTLRLDLSKTTGVLVNFLTNAIRYSPAGGKIELFVRRSNAHVEFAVRDYGPGITRSEMKKIFQRYRRAKDDPTKGTGLGLAISKEFIEAQGGKIWAESQPGKGSTFYFALPVSTTQPAVL
ncbi:MAG: HAMP domain-containing protein [Bacteroidetes bacterium]|nr:MAG: HAMP domain-containing protein [Bacteroidota bacterium]